MSKLSLTAAAAAIVISFFASFVPTRPAEATIIYPWCGYYGGRGNSGGGANCGFVTRDQCMAAISGTQGFCNINPWWEGPVPQAGAVPQVRQPR